MKTKLPVGSQIKELRQEINQIGKIIKIYIGELYPVIMKFIKNRECNNYD